MDAIITRDDIEALEALGISQEAAAAVQRLAGVSPKALMEARDNPESVQRDMRLLYVLHVGIMHKRITAEGAGFPVAQHMKFIELLGKGGKVASDVETPLTADRLPQIVINIPYYGDQPSEPKTVQGKVLDS